MSSLNKKVFVTGYHGFTGKKLARLLESQGFIVFGGENEHEVDITDYEKLCLLIEKINPNFVIHLAAISNVVNQSESEFYKVNLFGTENLLRALAATQSNPEKIIIASSAYVYGNRNLKILDESLCPKPVNHYGISKLAMEHIVTNWFEKFPIIITRPFNYTGPGQQVDFLIPKIVAHFSQKKPIIELGNLEIVRDISDINFTMQAYYRLLISKADSCIVNICSGIGYSIKDVLELMTEISGHRISINKQTSLIRKNEIFSLIGSNEYLFKIIGKIAYVPLKITLENMYNAGNF